MFLTFILVEANVYPGFGFTGGIDGSKINRNSDNPFLPNGNLKNEAALPPTDLSFEELDPNYLANQNDRALDSPDNMISRGNFLSTPVPDNVREKIMEKADNNDSLPFDYTKGFVNNPNDRGMTQSSNNLISVANDVGVAHESNKPKQPQALIVDPEDPRNNAIVDVPPDGNYYPFGNPYIVVESDEPIKMKNKNDKPDSFGDLEDNAEDYSF